MDLSGALLYKNIFTEKDGILGHVCVILNSWQKAVLHGHRKVDFCYRYFENIVKSFGNVTLGIYREILEIMPIFVTTVITFN